MRTNMIETNQILRDYRQKRGLTCAEFAVLLGVAEPTARSLENGHRKITAERAVDIERRTKGEVTRQELRPDLYVWKQRAAA